MKPSLVTYIKNRGASFAISAAIIVVLLAICVPIVAIKVLLVIVPIVILVLLAWIACYFCGQIGW